MGAQGPAFAAMSTWIVWIFLLGGALGLIVGVRALLLALIVWALTPIALAAFDGLGRLGAWLAAGAALQCGYFVGLALRALAQPAARGEKRVAKREKGVETARDAEGEGS